MSKKRKAKAAEVQKAKRGRPQQETDTSTTKGRFGAYMRRLRELQNLTAEQCAAEAGVSYSTWNNWETGRNSPNLDGFAAIAKVFGYDTQLIADLFKRESEPTTKSVIKARSPAETISALLYVLDDCQVMLQRVAAGDIPGPESCNALIAGIRMHLTDADRKPSELRAKPGKRVKR